MSLGRNTLWGATGAYPSDIRHAFDRYFPHDQRDVSSAATSQWAPRVDIKEEAQRFVIFVDVPGVDPASIEVSMDKGMLSIKGSRAADKGEQGSRFTHVERAQGNFDRRFALPDTADADSVSATGKHAVAEAARHGR